jgi:hypothetical protein
MRPDRSRPDPEYRNFARFHSDQPATSRKVASTVTAATVTLHFVAGGLRPTATARMTAVVVTEP